MLLIGPSNDRELAQLVERHPYKVDVAGSNPVLPTNLMVSLNWHYRISSQIKQLHTLLHEQALCSAFQHISTYFKIW